MKAAGICHTDVGILTDPGWMTMLAQVPVTLGHEDAGVISQVGEGVDDFQVGDRVAICPTTPAGCPGSSFDGGFGPKIVVGTQALVRIPDEVDFVNGAAATDAGMTSYAAVVRRGGVKAGDRVGIIGLGGLGQIGARVAHLLGAEVHVAEIKEDIWPLAKELGAVDARQSITDYPKGFFDVIVDFAGFGDTTADAVDVIRLGGVVVLVGMGRLETTIDAKSLIVNQCDLRGSNGGTPDDYRIIVGYGYDEEEGKRLWMQTRAALRAKYPAAQCEVGLLQIGSTIAVHTGPYALGMGIMRRWKKQ